MIESVLAALKTGRNIYCDEKNIVFLQQNFDDKLNFLLKENKEEILNKKIEEQFKVNSTKYNEPNNSFSFIEYPIRNSISEILAFIERY